MRGFERRNVHRVVAGITVDGDGVEVKARLVKVTDHRDAITRYGAAIGAARRSHAQCADNDFFNVVELCHYRAVTCDNDFSVCVQRQAGEGGERCSAGVDDEAFRRRCVGRNGEGIFIGSTIHKVTTTGRTVLCNRVYPAVGDDDVVTSATVDGVVTRKGKDRITVCRTRKGVGRSSSVLHCVVHAIETQCFNRSDRIDTFSSRIVGYRDGRTVRDQREVAARSGKDRRVGIRAAIDGVVAGTTGDDVVTSATVQDVITGCTVHGIRTTQQVGGVSTVGDVVTRRTREGTGDQWNAHEVVSNNAGYRRGQRFNRTDTIGEAGCDPQDCANLCLSRGKAGSRCAGDVGPSCAIVRRRLPLIGQGSNAIDVGNAANVKGQGLCFSWRQVADYRRTSCSNWAFDDGCGNSRSQCFQCTCGDVGEGCNNL